MTHPSFLRQTCVAGGLLLRPLALLLSLSTLTMAAQTRIAILGDVEKCRAEIDCLTATLSKQPGVELAERSEIDKVATEWKLSSMGMSTDAAIKAGTILGAKGVIIVKSFPWEGKDVLSARLAGTESGAILGAWIQDTPSKEADHFADAVKFKFSPLFDKLKLDRGDILAVSLLSMRFPIDSLEGRDLERRLTLLLSQRLMMERSLVVLERWRLGNVAWEKELNLDANPLWTGSCIVDGAIGIPDEQGQVKVCLRLSRPGSKPQTIETDGNVNDLKPLAEKLVAALSEKLGRTTGGAQTAKWDMKKEAEFYFREAEWLLRAGSFDRAREAADASRALGKDGPEIVFTLIKSNLAEIETAKLKSEFRNARRKGGADGDGNPLLMKANADKLIQALDIYIKFVEAGPRSLPGPFSKERDWRMLGNQLMLDAWHILRAINASNMHLTQPEWAEKASFIRAMTRKAAALTMDKGDDAYTMVDFYWNYIGVTMPTIFETPEDLASEFRRLLAREFPLQPGMRHLIRHRIYSFRTPQLCWTEVQRLRAGGRPAFGRPSFTELVTDKHAPLKERVDAFILAGKTVPPEEISSLLWEGREELLSGKGQTGNCLEAFFDNYESSGFPCLELLLYAFAQDKVYDGRTLALMVGTLAERKKANNVTEENCRKVAKGWYDYYARVKDKNGNPPLDESEEDYRFRNMDLKGWRQQIEASLAKVSPFHPLIASSQADIPLISPSLSIQMERHIPKKPSENFVFRFEKSIFHDETLQVSCRSPGRLMASPNDRAYLFTVNDRDLTFSSIAAPHYSSVPSVYLRNNAAPCGLTLKDGGDVFFADMEGGIYVAEPGRDWRKLTDTGFKMATDITAFNDKLYVGYGHCSPENYLSQIDVSSIIIQVDRASGKWDILASSRRNPPLTSMDNCHPWLPASMTFSKNGILLVESRRYVDSSHVDFINVFNPAKGEERQVASSYFPSYLHRGDIVLQKNALAERYHVFDRNDGKVTEVDLTGIRIAPNHADMATPDHKNPETSTRLTAYDGKAARVTQLDKDLFNIGILDLKSGKLFKTKFKLETRNVDPASRFIRDITLSGKRLYLILADSDYYYHNGVHPSMGELTSACTLAIDLDLFMKPQFEAAGRKDETTASSSSPEIFIASTQEPADLKPGLMCDFYKGAWSRFPDTSSMKPTMSKVEPSFKTPGLDWCDEAAFKFTGYIKIEKEGKYQFKTDTPFASCFLHIDGIRLNCHTLILKPGYHKIRLDLMTDTPGKAMSASIKTPGEKDWRSFEGMVFHSQNAK